MPASSTHFVFSELRERVARLEGGPTRRREVLPFGVPEIDKVLPGGGRRHPRKFSEGSGSSA